MKGAEAGVEAVTVLVEVATEQEAAEVEAVAAVEAAAVQEAVMVV